jgi:hypothetical protein
MPVYRGFISVQLGARTDDDARTLAEQYAGSLRGPDGSNPGHLELIGEVAEGTISVSRVVHEEPSFRKQLPPG